MSKEIAFMLVIAGIGNFMIVGSVLLHNYLLRRRAKQPQEIDWYGDA